MSRADLLARWLAPGNHYTPITITEWLRPYRIPRHVHATVSERVEPYWSRLQALEAEADRYFGAYEDEDGQVRRHDLPPDRAYWQPTDTAKAFLRRWKRRDALAEKALRQVPNPDYDPERAAAYWAARTTITTGQSYTPRPDDP